jgi:hypothetical protein
MVNQVRTWAPNFELVRIDGTSIHTFILIRDKNKPNQNGDVTIYALKDGFAEYNGNRNNYDADIYEPRELTLRYIASTFSSDYFIYLGQNGILGAPEIKILRYNHSYKTNIPPPDVFDDTRYEFVNTYTSNIVDVGLLVSVVDLSIDRYFINKDIYAITNDGIILRLTILNNGRLETSIVFRTGLDDCYRISVNTNKDLRPSFVVVTKDNIDYTVNSIINNRIIRSDSYTSTIDIEIKTGLNNIHFYDLDKLYIYNILEGTRFIYDFKDDPRIFSNLPYSFNFGSLSRYFNVTFGFDETTQPLENRKSIKLYYSLNERYGQTPVYKYTFHYDNDRIYKFTTSSSFTFDLLNESGVTMTDLEIFRIVLDIRVRYSNEQYDPSRPKKIEEAEQLPELETCIELCEEGENCVGPQCSQPKQEECPDGDCKIPQSTARSGILMTDRPVRNSECFKRCSRSVGSTARVLGLVGDDFTVSDFLNIYTNGV